MAQGMKFPLLTLAFSMLIHQKGKTLGAVGAVGFATGLCLMQLGMRQGALESMAVVPAHSTADIWVVPAGMFNFENTIPLEERDAYKLLSVEGVDVVEMVLVSNVQWRLKNGSHQIVSVVGLPRGATMLKPWNLVEGNLTSIHHDRSIIMDQTDLKKLDCPGIGHSTELFVTHTMAMEATVTGITEGIRTFVNTPIVFTGLVNARGFTRLGETRATAVLISVREGMEPKAVAKAINRSFGSELWAATRKDFCAMTVKYWSEDTGVGNFFLVMATMGIIIGVGTLAMVQHMQVTDHQRQFAILKALGASSTRIIGLVLMQALLLGIVGYLVGVLLAIATKTVLHNGNFLIEVHLDFPLFNGVFLGTCLFSAVASLPGMFLIIRTDPEMVFRT